MTDIIAARVLRGAVAELEHERHEAWTMETVGEDWNLPRILQRVLLWNSDGVLQEQTYWLDQGDDGPPYWETDDTGGDNTVDVCPGQRWLLLSAVDGHIKGGTTRRAVAERGEGEG